MNPQRHERSHATRRLTSRNSRFRQRSQSRCDLSARSGKRPRRFTSSAAPEDSAETIASLDTGMTLSHWTRLATRQRRSPIRPLRPQWRDTRTRSFEKKTPAGPTSTTRALWAVVFSSCQRGSSGNPCRRLRPRGCRRTALLDASTLSFADRALPRDPATRQRPCDLAQVGAASRPTPTTPGRRARPQPQEPARLAQPGREGASLRPLERPTPWRAASRAAWESNPCMSR